MLYYGQKKNMYQKIKFSGECVRKPRNKEKRGIISYFPDIKKNCLTALTNP